MKRTEIRRRKERGTPPFPYLDVRGRVLTNTVTIHIREYKVQDRSLMHAANCSRKTWNFRGLNFIILANFLQTISRSSDTVSARRLIPLPFAYVTSSSPPCSCFWVILHWRLLVSELNYVIHVNNRCQTTNIFSLSVQICVVTLL
jgi:hypothetical protein